MVEDVVANYLRVTSCLEIEKASSGHPGVCLGAAPIFEAIYKKAFFCSDKPNFIARDRIVISAGHASALLYATLNLFGFNVTNEDLKNFRQLGSITSGHPEAKVTPGVDVTTGPLGQGIANAVGFAIAEDYLRNRFKKENLSPINNYTYCFCGDGCLMEGVALEAISLAGNLALNKLIVIYDRNNITIEGKLNITNTEDPKAKFLACNWNVLEVKNGTSVKDIEKAIEKAQTSNKPTVIIVSTHIGFGSELEDNNKVHGNPLNKQQIEYVRKKLNYFTPDWEMPNEVKEFAKQIEKKNKDLEEKYYATLKKYKEKYPKEFNEFLTLNNNFEYNFAKLVSTTQAEVFNGREDLHKILNLLGEHMPNFIGGTADLSSSTKVFYDNEGLYSKVNKNSRNIAYGIREHAMGAISNGIALYGPLRAFCSTYLVFEEYLTPAVRMSALMENPVLYLFTHDSYTVGEDGPTHQPVEQLATLRCLPNMYIFRPAGWNEILASFTKYFKQSNPCAIVIPRPKVKFVKDDYYKALKGAYVLNETSAYNATIIATGSEVCLAQEVGEICAKNGIKLKVVSMPCVELFEEQDANYKASVIDKSKPVFCLEASSDNVWYKYATDDQTIFNLTCFGKSGKVTDLAKHFGFDAKTIAAKIMQYMLKK